MLPDGTYDAVVVDAVEVDGAVSLDLTILAGEHKGDVVSLRSTDLTGDPVGFLGIPGTLTVTDGTPRLVLEP